MSFQNSFPHAFTLGSIRAHAPASPGVYGLSNPRQWILVAESDNIQQSLIDHLSQVALLQPHGITGFAYEVCYGPVRADRCHRLIHEYRPALNLGGGNDNGGSQGSLASRRRQSSQ